MDANKLKVRDQLVQGHELTTQLQQLLSQPEFGLVPANDFVAKILRTFSDSISALAIDSFEPFSSSSLVAVEGSENASCDYDGKFEDSSDSRKRLGPVKGKRGCYKRKKRSETWTVQGTVPDDSFSWRKYGQKEILNSNFPRSYFRCTHKYTQGCKATKQVQKMDLEPKMFNITYIGKHTCNNNNGEKPNIKPCDHHHHDEIIMDSEELKSPSLTTSTKEEEENHHHQQHYSSSTEKDLSLVWPDIVLFEDDYHHHEAIYGYGHETSASINVLCSKDHMVFGEAISDFVFSDDEHLSIFDSFSNL